ncbi:hypothetical protein D9M71_675680 [compost metagenome]
MLSDIPNPGLVQASKLFGSLSCFGEGHRAFQAIAAVCPDGIGDTFAAAVGVAEIEEAFSAGGDASDQAAMPPDGDLAQPFITGSRFGRHLTVSNLGHVVSFPVANWLPIKNPWLPIRCQLKVALFGSHWPILDRKTSKDQ